MCDSDVKCEPGLKCVQKTCIKAGKADRKAGKADRKGYIPTNGTAGNENSNATSQISYRFLKYLVL